MMPEPVSRLSSQSEHHKRNSGPEDHVEHDSNHDVTFPDAAFHLTSSLIAGV
jgi:hypothetical protein